MKRHSQTQLHNFLSKRPRTPPGLDHTSTSSESPSLNSLTPSNVLISHVKRAPALLPKQVLSGRTLTYQEK